MEKDEALQQLGRLISEQRWAALATVDQKGDPQASMVAYVPEPGFSGILLHLSQLAAHTRNLLETSRASLVITEPDDRECDPQTLARASFSGPVRAIARDGDEYSKGKERYLARLPDAEQLFAFGDFTLLRLQPRSIRFVAGFGRAFSFSETDLAELGES
jgi:putative heme iron utilization protein